MRARGEPSAEEVFSTLQEYCGEDMDTYLKLVEPRAEELEAQALRDPGFLNTEEQRALDFILRGIREGRLIKRRGDEPPVPAQVPSAPEAAPRPATRFLGGLMRTKPAGDYRDTRPAIPGASGSPPASSQRDAVQGMSPGGSSGGRAGAGEEGGAGGNMFGDRNTCLLVQHLR